MPFTLTPLLERVGFAAYLQDRSFLAVESNGEGAGHVGIRGRARGADEFGADDAFITFDVKLFAADVLTFALGAGGVVGEGALAAAKVGDAHGGKHDAAEFLRGEGYRNTNDVTEDAVLAQDGPERFALAEQANVRFPDRDFVLSNFDLSAGAADVHGTQLGQVRTFITGQEIEDIVLAGVDAGLETGPGNR